jgi:drug/metabolite transporter (DMT)-like permease
MNLDTNHRKKVILSDLGLLYAAAIWGSTFFLVKDALSDVDPVVMVGYRFLLAGGVMLIYLRVTGRKFFVGVGRALFLSVVLFLLYIPQTVGLKYTTASNSGFITGLFVFFTPLLLRWLFKKKPTLMEWIGSVVSVAGLGVLTGGLQEINFGDALTLVAALTYALHVLYSDKYIKAGVDPYVISCQQFLFVGLLSVITGWVLDLPFAVTSAKAGWVILFLALGPTLSAFVIQMLAQRITTPVKVTLIFALEPVFAALFAWTIGGEQIETHRAFGGLLIVIALAVSGIRTPRFLVRRKSQH